MIEKKIVNSWNEWDPLKHVIVGRADGTCIPAPEPALDAKVPEESDMRGKYGPRTKDQEPRPCRTKNTWKNDRGQEARTKHQVPGTTSQTP